jgi:hypothetical protein
VLPTVVKFVNGGKVGRRASCSMRYQLCELGRGADSGAAIGEVTGL